MHVTFFRMSKCSTTIFPIEMILYLVKRRINELHLSGFLFRFCAMFFDLNALPSVSLLSLTDGHFTSREPFRYFKGVGVVWVLSIAALRVCRMQECGF